MENGSTGLTTRPPGKFQVENLKQIVLSKLGRKHPKVIIPPGVGRDFNAVELSNGKILVTTTDPLYVNPIFGIKDAAWLGFQIILSDFLMSSVNPQYAIFSLNLPNSISHDTLEQIWSILDAECSRTNISIISGHTGSYDGCEFPIIGTGTMIGTCDKGKILNTDNISSESDILLVNNPGMEAIASLIKIDGRTGKDVFGPDYEKMKESAWNSLSFETPVHIIQEIISKYTKNGQDFLIEAMHDVAEKGVLGAVKELCEATKLGCNLNLDNWNLDERLDEFITKYFEDPRDIWKASGQGGLLIACNSIATPVILGRMKDMKIKAGKIGSFTEAGLGKSYTIEEREHEFPQSIEDPFWPVFQDIINKIKNKE
ncbi:MAG: AIR synthase related protein [Candidatus Hodarchaeota archaeon]